MKTAPNDSRVSSSIPSAMVIPCVGIIDLIWALSRESRDGPRSRIGIKSTRINAV